MISKARGGFPSWNSDGDGVGLGEAMAVTVVVPADVASDVRVIAVVTVETIGVLGGEKARYSAPRFP